MREIRTYGSVRGVARKGHPYRDKMGGGTLQKETEATK
jgi:hypothetical protein